MSNNSAESPGPGLKALGSCLVGFDSCLWLLMCGPCRPYGPAKYAKKSTTEVGQPDSRVFVVRTDDVNGQGKPGSKVFRHAAAKQKLIGTFTEHADLGSVWDLIRYAHTAHAQKRALGTRKLNSIDKTLHKFPTKMFGETRWRTFADVGKEAREFGSGLRALGMTPLNLANKSFDDATGQFNMLVYEKTCAEWHLAMQGAFSQSIVVSTAYATLGVDAVVAAVQEGSVSTILCNRSHVDMLLAKKSSMPSLKNLIYTFDQIPESERTAIQSNQGHVAIHTFDEVKAKGAANLFDATPPKPEDIAILMYTSGSTGKPKGVVIKHSNMVATISSGVNQMSIKPGAYCAFLPLAHIFEMILEVGQFYLGGEIGYADPKTLMAGPGTCLPTGALAEFRPTVFAAVPKVYETIKAKGDATLQKISSTKQFIFHTAYAAKTKATSKGRSTPLFDVLLFNKMKLLLGGRLELAASGGGAIAGEVQEWVRNCIGCPICQGYGLTETSMGLTMQMPDDQRLGIVGSPIPCVEVLLHSEPDFADARGKPYLASDTVDADGNPCLGRGEVWVRGECVGNGYYKMQKETVEAFGSDGWFKTGDIAQALPDGSLKIVDRKKNLVKLKGGEYVALEKMNQAFNNSEWVDKENGGVCSYGDDSIDRPVALVQVDHKKILELGKSLGISGDLEACVKDARVQKTVLDSLNACGKAAGLPVLETLSGVALLTKPWSSEDGTMTATFKLTPSKIKIVNAKELEAVKAKGRK